MLDHFDTVFAFVAILTGASLVVTSLTQVVGALLGLRGRHLQWGLASLLENYLPELRGYGEALSRQLLHHPLVSDSVFSDSRWVPSKGIGAWLSFLWHGWKYATVVRPREVIEIVTDLGRNVEALVPAAERVLGVMGRAPVTAEALEAMVKELKEMKGVVGVAGHWTRRAEAYLAALPSEAERAAWASDLRARWGVELGDFFRAIAGTAVLMKQRDRLQADGVAGGEAVGGVVEGGGGSGGVGGSGGSGAGGWSLWFDAAMERVSERFATHMRVWTVVFSVLVAFGGGLDALRLFDRLASDPEYRALVVTSVDGIVKRAEERLPLGGGAAGGDAGAGAGAGVAVAPAAAPASAPAPATGGVDDGEALQRVRAEVEELKSLIQAQSGLEIFRPGVPWEDGWRGVLGRGLAAMLLSLGAPFWFNTLRRMANLRPALAGKVEGGNSGTG